MKGPTYIEKDPHKTKFLDYSMSMHHRALGNIKTKKSRLLDCSTPDTYYLHHSRNPLTRHYVQEIVRENQSLLDRLLYISSKPKKSNKEPSPFLRKVPKSMNFTQRKNAKDEIHRENRSLAQRLASISPCVNRKIIEKGFNHHVQYKNIVQKYQNSETLDKSFGNRVKLPSLSEISSQKLMISNSPSGNIKNPYVEEQDSYIRKEWKIAVMSEKPSNKYLMAVPMAVSLS